MKIDSIQTSFTAGEFSSSLFGRKDIAQYANACALLENFLIRPYGPVISTPGTEFINDAKYDTLAGGNDDKTLLLLHFDTDPGFDVDSSVGGSGNTLTVNGLFAQDTGEGVFDESARATTQASSNTTNYLSVFPVDTDEYLDAIQQNASFTFDFRIKFNSFPVGTPAYGSPTEFYILEQIGGQNTGAAQDVSYFFYRRVDVNNHWFLWRIGQSGGSGTTFAATGLTLSLDTWYHVAYVNSASTIKIYLDGIEKSSNTILSNQSPATLNPEFLVAYSTSSNASNQFDGWLEEMRFSNVARWTSNFTVPDSEYGISDAGDGIASRVYGKARLIPFIFSRSDSYIIEVGEGYFRFYTDGAVVV